VTDPLTSVMFCWDGPGDVGSSRRAALGSLPGLTIAVIVVADLQVGHSVVLGLVVVAPLLAANVAGPRVTAAYVAIALVVGALLGLAKHLYLSGEALLA
jgi:hypothetical protein